MFKECERRGESKLLFDSVSVEKAPAKSRCGDLRNSIEQRDDIWTEFDDEFVYEVKNTWIIVLFISKRLIKV